MKNNIQAFEFDFTPEIEGVEDSSTIFLIGRSPECHVVLDDMTVSREHARIKYENRKWFIEKVGDLTNLSVNGASVGNHELKNNDYINIGAFSINISIDETLLTETEITNSNQGIEENFEEEISDVDDSATITDISNTTEEQGSDDSVIDSGEGDNFSEEETSESSDGGDFESFDNQETEVTSDQGEFPESEADEYSENENFEDGEYNEEFQDEGDDEYALEESGGDRTQVIQTFYQVGLELFGEFAPYDKYLIDSNEVFIGRDSEKCNIVLNDPQVSSIHAVVRKTNISLELEDLQSGNGTTLNGDRVNKVEISNGDEFIIGDTTFTVRISSDFMADEDNRLMPVEENQVIEVEEIVEVDEEDFDGEEEINEFEEEKSPIKRAWKDPKKKKIIIGVGLLLAVLMFMDTEEPVDNNKKKAKPKTLVEKDADKKKALAKKQKLKPEDQEFLDATYQLGSELLDQAKFLEAKLEFEKILSVVPDYKNTKTLIAIAANGLREKEEAEKKRREEEERKERRKKINDLVEKAKVAVKEKKKTVADALFSKILELDPENFDVPQLKIEIDAWVREQERIALEKATKEAERKRKVGLAKPSKTYYIQQDWYNAIIKLEDFLKIKDMDEDLVKDAIKMLEDSRKQLKNMVDPMLGKARSLKEGQDLKGAYEFYKKILKFDPVNTEALDEMNTIMETLTNRSKKVYREAIVSESLSLFDDAKEKFQEVQQMSPSDSDYYKKATDKLKNYLD